MKIQVSMPHTSLGRLIATLLIIIGVAVVVFFFAAILILVAVAGALYFLRSVLTRKKKQTTIRADEVSAEYEVLNEDEGGKNGRRERLLPGASASDSRPREDTR